MEITIATGEARPVTKTYQDGSHECPWCVYAVPAGGVCQNPGCYVNGTVETIEASQARMAEDARRQAERDHYAKAARKAREMREAAQAAEIYEVRAAGQCVGCYIRAYGKRIRHRAGHQHIGQGHQDA